MPVFTIRNNLPELGADLVAALACLDVDNLAHSYVKAATSTRVRQFAVLNVDHSNFRETASAALFAMQHSHVRNKTQK